MELSNIDNEVTEDSGPTLEEKVDHLIEILEPIAAFVRDDLPELKDKVGPMVEAFGNSPVAKMLGIRV